MTAWTLLRRNLLHFRWANLAVAAGVAVATAVLSGALMVGDSVNGSLRDLALRRLGPVDYAAAGATFFRDDLGRRIAASAELGRVFPSTATGILVRGSAADADGQARAAGVQIAALDDWLVVEPGRCVINAHLAEQLGAAVGDALVFTVPRATDVPGGAVLARVERGSRLAGLRAEVARVADDGWQAAFALQPTQRAQSLAWVNLGQLQRLVDQPDRANLFLLQAPAAAPAVDDQAYASLFTLDDYGLKLAPVNDAQAALTSRSTYLPPAVETALAGLPPPAPGRPWEMDRALVHLVNTVELLPAEPDGQGRSIHYAIVAGLDRAGGAWLDDDEIALNQWTAEQLGAGVGDRLTLTYYVRRPDGTLAERTGETVFRVAKVLAMEGYGADPALTPEYPGITDAASVADWSPPADLTIRREWITPADEQYWEQYRAAPKLFVSLATAQRLWGASFGRLTSVRVPAAQGDEFRRALLDRLNPADMGLALRPVRREQLAAATASTDFGQLFLGLSFFLIAAAAFLIALLYRLGVEQRARQLGLLLALGFGPRATAALTLAEGGLVALAGVLAGSAAAVGYTAAMMAALRTWWVGAVGTTALALHVRPPTLAAGGGAALAAALLAMLWGVRRIGRASATDLLGGGWGVAGGGRGGRAAPAVAVAATILGAAVLTAPLYSGLALQWATLAGSGALLVAALAALAALLRPRGSGRGQAASLIGLGVRNAGRRPARSVLTAGLLAMATFVVVIVAAFRQGAPADTRDPRSGAGGYAIVVEADIPLPNDLSTPQARQVAGFVRPDAPLWRPLRWTALPRRRGQDISCLNLTRATDPAILAVPPAEQWAGRFSFARTLAEADNPWTLLDGPADDAVPVIADDETARYILHLDVGQTLQLPAGPSLRLVGTLRAGIFQGALLMSRENFQRLFPQADGFGVVLIEAATGEAGEVRRELAAELADYAATADFTRDAIARYLEVANTYLATFQTLGAMGLMLGTVGLTVVLLRNLVERRSELALLAALGFSPAARAGLLVWENAFLLLTGLALGLAVALVAVLPVGASARAVNWAAVLSAVGAAMALGLAVQTLAGWLRGRRFSPADLRPE